MPPGAVTASWPSVPDAGPSSLTTDEPTCCFRTSASGLSRRFPRRSRRGIVTPLQHSLLKQGGHGAAEQLVERAVDFRVDASFTPPLAVLKVRGELDLSTAPTLSWSVAQAVEGRCGLVLLDLGDVSFVDCSGIGALVEAAHLMDAASAHLSVNRVSPQVARMLEITGTDALFGLRGVVPGRTS